MPAGLTLIVPYYRQPEMLQRQAGEWALYPEELKIILVDDGSPETAMEALESVHKPPPLSVYRITKDIPWNRNGARNLGAHVATTDWIMHIDIDHILPAECAIALMATLPSLYKETWYRFPRYRVGMADETRKKDAIPDRAEYGEIKPHIDSYVMRRADYFKLGGYDERYAGCLGGGGIFLRNAETMLGRPELFGRMIYLEVYTRSEIADSSEHTLSRDTEEYSRRKRAFGHLKPIKPLNFPWHQEL